MKNDHNLTKADIEKLSELGISEAEILLKSRVDLTFDGEYAEGFIVVTKDKVSVVTGKLSEGYVNIFGGVETNDNAPVSEVRLTDTAEYDLNELAHLRLDPYIGSNVLTGEYEGRPVRIAAFTNRYSSDMNVLYRKLRTLIKTGELSHEEEDVEAEIEEADPKKKSKRSIFARTLKYFLKYKLQIVILFLTYAVSAVIGIAWPYLTGKVLFDNVLAMDDEFLSRFGLGGRYTLALLIVTLMMIGVRLIQAISNYLQIFVMAKVASDTVRDIKTDVFDAMSRLSLNFFVNKQTGGLMTRVLSDSERVREFFIDGLPMLFVHGITIIATFTVMYRLNWKMALIACILLPLLVYMTVKLRPGLWTLSGKRHRAEKAVTAKANDNLTGARVVKSFGQQESEMERFMRPSNNLRDAEINIVRLRNRFAILYNMVQEVSSIWIWIIGVYFVLGTGEIELGVLITFVGYVMQLNGPMNFFSYVFRIWSESINSAERLFEIIDAIPEIREKEDPVRLEHPRGEIELKDVTFGYRAGRPVLKNINLKIREGEMLGIVGRSGAGKSTLVNLISRLYDVNEGSISIDGVDVKDLSLKDLRRNVAMVSQDTYIFMGTVAKNIAYGNESASREDIIRAAKLASAHEFISKLPDGYDTLIGASGKDLSGGEKQRISIARAILANPKILILDEATASVDTETEKAIQYSLRFLVKGRTTLSIAHRLSTLHDADRLIVIDGGRIVEEGTEEELNKLEDGIFHNLLELQNKSLSLNSELLTGAE
ncbi:MAG: ABC transporter ATP-binding protein/permease [Lachnospiraceae bacterium]|nr:ABC transporter ATP-binding protein/permease [Lachnospiraceae bacterium]